MQNIIPFEGYEKTIKNSHHEVLSKKFLKKSYVPHATIIAKPRKVLVVGTFL